ncbi:ABC transporter substrate-binding protein [Maridesulfovibrio sp.]|uniref:ABC transporter substrate-binding protein n=1 Tax=Maridesulfovibrio sp. TaxID=2795000 RepID=UPI003BAC4FA3
MVNSYNRDFKWVEEHNGILKRGLSGKADVFFHYLDFKRLSKEQAERNVEAVKIILAEQKPEVVVLTDDYALKSLGQFLVDRDIPVVFLGINGNARGYVDNVRKITGVLERPLVKRSILYLKEIIGPEMDKCLVLMDDSLSSRVFVEENMRGKLSFDVSGVHTDIKLIKSFEDWKDAVKAVPSEGYPCIVLGLYHIFRDEHGRHIPSDEVLAWTSKFSSVPVFGLWSFSVGKGKAVGGYVLSGVDQGREALKIVKTILAGEKTENIPPVIGRNGRLLFSAPEMKRWKIKLPDTITSKGYLVRVIR